MQWDGKREGELITWLTNHPRYKFDFVKANPEGFNPNFGDDEEAKAAYFASDLLFIYSDKAFDMVTVPPGYWLQIAVGWLAEAGPKLCEVSDGYMHRSCVMDGNYSGAVETALILADPQLVADLKESLDQMARGEGELIDVEELNLRATVEARGDDALASVLFRLNNVRPDLALEVERVLATVDPIADESAKPA